MRKLTQEEKISLRKAIFYVSKTIWFIFTIVFVFLFTRVMYYKNLLEKMAIASGIEVMEVVFLIGIILGIWLFFSFLVLVLAEYNEIIKVKQDVQQK